MFIKPKGTYDLYEEELELFQKLIDIVVNTAKLYNFRPIKTPLFEYSEVFHRKNEQSDMVKKETYDFLDKAGRKLTLRPEQTAGIVRSFVENKLYVDNSIKKFYSVGTNYRYERPQKGRFREFYQFGVEVFADQNYIIDFEIIKLLFDIATNLGLNDLVIHINSLGNSNSKKTYNDKLYNYFYEYKNELCKDCMTRLDSNTLRILDCKICSSKEFFNNTPKSIDNLDSDSKNYFDSVIKLLEKFNINYVIDNNLVRGLDYYSEIVYELKANVSGLNATIGGGGRYNSLVSELGGPDICGSGFAIGLERLFELYKTQNNNLQEKRLDCYMISLTNIERSYEIVNLLRDNNISVDINHIQKSFKALLKNALNQNPKYLLFYGDNEYEKKEISVKNTNTQKQENIKISNLIDYLKGVIK